MGDLELVLDAKATLGEGPCWDAEKQILYWVDIKEKKVNLFNPATGENLEIQLKQNVGTIVPRNEKEAALALEDGLYLLNLETEKLTLIEELESDIEANRFNDGKCDPAGRFWAGTMDKEGAAGKGALYCLDADGKIEKKLGQLGISNGLAWSPDDQFMYFIDTPTGKISRFDYDIKTGAIENRTEIISIPEGAGAPDGMTIDEEGKLWIAHYGGAKVSRWDPHTGEQLMEIKVPARNVTSCTFGGKDLRDLYITTARDGLSEEQLKEYPMSGGLFRIKLEVKGRPAYSFKG
jgi:sugar lactone lactonase YvrE